MKIGNTDVMVVGTTERKGIMSETEDVWKVLETVPLDGQLICIRMWVDSTRDRKSFVVFF